MARHNNRNRRKLGHRELNTIIRFFLLFLLFLVIYEIVCMYVASILTGPTVLLFLMGALAGIIAMFLYDRRHKNNRAFVSLTKRLQKIRTELNLSPHETTCTLALPRVATEPDTQTGAPEPAPAQASAPAPACASAPACAPAPAAKDTSDHAPAPTAKDTPDRAPAPAAKDTSDHAPAPTAKDTPACAPAPTAPEPSLTLLRRPPKAASNSPLSDDLANLTAEAPKYSKLSLSDLTRRLVGNADPMAELRLLQKDILDRARTWKGQGHWEYGRTSLTQTSLASRALEYTSLAAHKDSPDTDSNADSDLHQTLIPSGIELFLAHRLAESGLNDPKIELPRMHIIRPHTSGMFYLRIEQAQTPYDVILAVLRIEYALNAVRFITTYFDDPSRVSEADCIRLMQSITNSIVSQATPIDQYPKLEKGEREDGEWTVRHGISKSIESFQLPYRLQVNFRTNVSDGNVAMELQVTPADAFPATYMWTGHSSLKTTRKMRRQAASEYALRLAILLAACAFRQSERIKHVWVAGILDTATRHSCLYSIDFDRWRFAKVNFEDTRNLQEVLHPFCPQLRVEDGFLRPIVETFALSEERFCPRRRYESISLSSRRLDASLAKALGTDHVSGLAINEANKREIIADDIVRHLAGPDDERATEHNVHAILQIAGDDPDPSVRSAAERTAEALARGTISDDPIAVAEEFVTGDALTRACTEAQSALVSQDVTRAIKVLQAALSPIDEAGLYEDSDHVVWRYFANFVDRALYNRLEGESLGITNGTCSLVLIPQSYYNAHLLLSMALIADNKPKAATAHARLLIRIAPYDARSHLQLVRALESQDDNDKAIDALRALLEVAHDPQGVGTSYYRMAYFQWKKGNLLATRACYEMAIRFLPSAATKVAMELGALTLQAGEELTCDLTDKEISNILAASNIPAAPTDRVSEAFFECTRASLDAELFPVARNFLYTLASFVPDDIIVGVMRSVEDAPDSA